MAFLPFSVYISLSFMHELYECRLTGIPQAAQMRVQHVQPSSFSKVITFIRLWMKSGFESNVRCYSFKCVAGV